jgi:hypothetical protein
VSLVGLLGRSAKEGYWRLYFSNVLDHYAELKEEDVLYSMKIPREQSPFAGLEATRVRIREDAEVEYTRTESPRVRAEVPAEVLQISLGGTRVVGTIEE